MTDQKSIEDWIQGCAIQRMTCTAVTWGDAGDVHLEFSDGHQIDVPSHDKVTAWGLYGK